MIQLIVRGSVDSALSKTDDALRMPWLCVRAVALVMNQTVILAAPAYGHDRQTFEDAIVKWYGDSQKPSVIIGMQGSLVWWQRFQPQERGSYVMDEETRRAIIQSAAETEKHYLATIAAERECGA